MRALKMMADLLVGMYIQIIWQAIQQGLFKILINLDIL